MDWAVGMANVAGHRPVRASDEWRHSASELHFMASNESGAGIHKFLGIKRPLFSEIISCPTAYDLADPFPERKAGPCPNSHLLKHCSVGREKHWEEAPGHREQKHQKKRWGGSRSSHSIECGTEITRSFSFVTTPMRYDDGDTFGSLNCLYFPRGTQAEPF